MRKWRIYLDVDGYHQFLGTISAEDAQTALRLAAQYFEYEMHRLLVEIGS